MFAWLGLLPRTERLASLKKISYFLARRAATAAVAAVAMQGTRGDVERRREDEDEEDEEPNRAEPRRTAPHRGFHNVPVLRRQEELTARILRGSHSEDRPLMSSRPEERIRVDLLHRENATLAERVAGLSDSLRPP